MIKTDPYVRLLKYNAHYPRLGREARDGFITTAVRSRRLVVIKCGCRLRACAPRGNGGGAYMCASMILLLYFIETRVSVAGRRRPDHTHSAPPNIMIYAYYMYIYIYHMYLLYIYTSIYVYADSRRAGVRDCRPALLLLLLLGTIICIFPPLVIFCSSFTATLILFFSFPKYYIVAAVCCTPCSIYIYTYIARR